MRLANWKNFKAVEIPVERRTFIVGPNASGKSNFLDVFRFLHDLAKNGGGLQSAVASRGGVSAIRSLAARRQPEITIAVTLADSERMDAWAYELAFEQDTNRIPQITREVVTRAGTILLERPNTDDGDDAERLTQTHLEQVSANKAFREIAEFFDSVRYLHVVPQLVRDPERSIGRMNDPFGGDLLDQMSNSQEKIVKSRLERIRKALTVAVPQLAELELARDSRGTPHLRGRFQNWRPNSGWQTEGQLSDGTLRLIGLLWSITDGSGPLLLEEPELSLHSAVVQEIPELVARVQRRSSRQIIISTHADDFFYEDGVGADEVIVASPTSEGSTLRIASSVAEVTKVLRAGETLAQAITPLTRPNNVMELPLYGDR